MTVSENEFADYKEAMRAVRAHRTLIPVGGWIWDVLPAGTAPESTPLCALYDPYGDLVASFSTSFDEIELTDFGEVDLGGAKTLDEAMTALECEAMDWLGIVPEPGRDFETFLEHCAGKASRELWADEAGNARLAPSPDDIPLHTLLASGYAASYPEGRKTAPALEEAYREYDGEVSLVELIKENALCHAEADIDLCSELFQQRGAESVFDVASSINERLAREREGEAASIASRASSAAASSTLPDPAARPSRAIPR